MYCKSNTKTVCIPILIVFLLLILFAGYNISYVSGKQDGDAHSTHSSDNSDNSDSTHSSDNSDSTHSSDNSDSTHSSDISVTIDRTTGISGIPGGQVPGPSTATGSNGGGGGHTPSQGGIDVNTPRGHVPSQDNTAGGTGYIPNQGQVPGKDAATAGAGGPIGRVPGQFASTGGTNNLGGHVPSQGNTAGGGGHVTSQFASIGDTGGQVLGSTPLVGSTIDPSTYDTCISIYLPPQIGSGISNCLNMYKITHIINPMNPTVVLKPFNGGWCSFADYTVKDINGQTYCLESDK